jgi:hypothetical protein
MIPISAIEALFDSLHRCEADILGWGFGVPSDCAVSQMYEVEQRVREIDEEQGTAALTLHEPVADPTNGLAGEGDLRHGHGVSMVRRKMYASKARSRSSED